MEKLIDSEVALLIGGFLSDAEVNKVTSHLAQGGSLLIKYDGNRADSAVWTVVVSDGLMKDGFYREDGTSISELLKASAAEIIESKE